MKIAIVTNRFYPEVGGAEINVFQQAKALAEMHDVTVFCPKRSKEVADHEMIHGFTIYRLKDILNKDPDQPNLGSKTLCPSLFWKIALNDFDIVHCFPAINNNNFLAFLAAKMTGKKYILCFFDYLDYATLIKNHKIKKNFLEHYQPSWKEKLILRNSDWLFYIAEREGAFLRKYNQHVDYSPVPIIIEEFEQNIPSPFDKYGISSNSFVFLCLGRVSYIKGQDIALKAFSEIANKIPDSFLVLVGRNDYDADFAKNLKQYAFERGLNSRFIMTGLVDRQEALAWLHHADMHVIPVRFMNSGAVIIESWSSGTPVLQSDIVDPNLVIEGRNGYLFKNEDIHELSEKMFKAYQEKDQFGQLVQNGKRLIQEKQYNYSSLIDTYNKIYERIVNE